MKYFCPKCNTEFITVEEKGKPIQLICDKCGFKPSKKEISAIYECSLIEEDMKYWRNAQKYR